MGEPGSNLTKNLFSWIIFFDEEELLHAYYANIKPQFSAIESFCQLTKSKIFYISQYTQYRCWNQKGNLIYNGEIKDEKRNGYGVEYYENTQKVKFDGKFKDDKPNGNFCKYYDENGYMIFLGNFANGFPEFGIFFDKEIDSVKYIGWFKDYKLHGENCYQFGKGDKILASGQFIYGMPDNQNFTIYYKSGCVLYEAKNDDKIYGHVYHDGLFDQSKNRIVNNCIYLPYKKEEFLIDVNYILEKTQNGENQMKLKYDYYDKHSNIKQVIQTTIKKNNHKIAINYLTQNSDLNLGRNIVIEVKDPLKNTNGVHLESSQVPQSQSQQQQPSQKNGFGNQSDLSSGGRKSPPDIGMNYKTYQQESYDPQCYVPKKKQPQDLIIKWYYPNQTDPDVQASSNKNIDNPDEDDSILTLHSINKEFVLIKSNYKHSTNKWSFQLEDVVINDYESPNDVAIYSDGKIYSGVIKLSFNYSLINDEKKKDSKFSYIGFQPKIELTSPSFRIYNTMWQLNYYGGLSNKKKNDYGTLYSQNCVIQAQWEDDKIKGSFRFHDNGCLRYMGYADGLDCSTFVNNDSIYNTQISQVDEPHFTTTQDSELNSPPFSVYGFTKWYHSNGKLGHIGTMKNGNRHGKFGIEITKNGYIFYCGGYKENLYHGKGIELYSGSLPQGISNGVKRLGTFVDGKLHGPDCFENNFGEVNIGTFEHGQVV